eukprot:gene5291-10583_t
MEIALESDMLNLSFQLLVFTAFIVVCIAISRIKTGSANSAVSFAGMWTILLLIGVSVCGTLIMRKFQTSIAIGFLLGIFFVLSNQMLIIFAIFIDHSKREVIQETIESDKAFAAFSFLLFLVYGIFGTMLGIFRNDVIKEVTLNEDDAVSGDKQANGNI